MRDVGRAVYYETFNRISGADGLNKVTTTNNVARQVDCDYTEAKFSYIYKANKYVYFGSSSSSYTTTKIPQPNKETTNVLLTFKVAGATTASKSAFLNVSYRNTQLTNKRTISIEIQKGSWSTVQLALNNFNFTEPIEFSGYEVFLDDVMVSELSLMEMNEGEDNASVISEHLGQYMNVSTTRTLKEGIWNTMCVPFEMSPTVIRNATGTESYDVYMKRFESVANGVFTFVSATTVPAGEPFLLQLKREGGLVNPTFKGVKIEVTEPQAVGSNGYFLQGIFSPTELKTDGTNLFLGTDGYLYAPAEGSNTMNGMRAYLVTPGGTSGSVRVRLVDDDDQLAGISTVPTAGRRDATIYTLSGQALGTNPNTLPQGIYVKGNKKVFIK